MKNRHKGRFAYLDATFRLFKSRNQNVFSTADVYDTYNILVPKVLRMSIQETAGFLAHYYGVFNLKKSHTENRTSSTGMHEVVIWTWR